MIRLQTCAEEHRWLLHRWRNDPEVRRYMYDDQEIPRHTHDAWYTELLTASDRRGWVVDMDGLPVGAAFMSGIDLTNRRATWAFYLADPSTRGRGVGGAVEFLVLRHAFEELRLHKLSCEVLSFNDAVVAMHKKFGFVEEGLLRDQWLRDGAYAHTHLLAMFEDVWRERSPQLRERLTSRGLISANA